MADPHTPAPTAQKAAHPTAQNAAHPAAHPTVHPTRLEVTRG